MALFAKLTIQLTKLVLILPLLTNADIIYNDTVIECVRPSYCAPFNEACNIVLDDIPIPQNTSITFWVSNKYRNMMYVFNFPLNRTLIVQTCNIPYKHGEYCWYYWNTIGSSITSSAEFLYLQIAQTYYKNNNTYRYNVSTFGSIYAPNAGFKNDEWVKVVDSFVLSGNTSEISQKEIDTNINGMCSDSPLWVLGSCPYGSQRKTALIVLSVFWILIAIATCIILTITKFIMSGIVNGTIKVIGGGWVLTNIAYFIAMIIMPRCTPQIVPYWTIYLAPLFLPSGTGLVGGIMAIVSYIVSKT